MWTDKGNSITYQCQSAYGSGGCLKSCNGGSYSSVKKSVGTAPPAYKAAKMPWDLKESPGTKQPIAMPAIPDYFFPGKKPIKALARGAASRGNRDFDVADLVEVTLVQRQATPSANSTAKASSPSSKVHEPLLEPKPYSGGRKHGTSPPPARW